MTRHRVEQALIAAFGLLVGLVLAMLIVPGEIGLWIIIAVLLAVFCRAFFIRGLYGELHWPIGRHMAKKANRPPARR